MNKTMGEIGGNSIGDSRWRRGLFLLPRLAFCQLIIEHGLFPKQSNDGSVAIIVTTYRSSHEMSRTVNGQTPAPGSRLIWVTHVHPGCRILTSKHCSAWLISAPDRTGLRPPSSDKRPKKTHQSDGWYPQGYEGIVLFIYVYILV